jgi:hypothetical protein
MPNKNGTTTETVEPCKHKYGEQVQNQHDHTYEWSCNEHEV